MPFVKVAPPVSEGPLPEDLALGGTARPFPMTSFLM